VGEEIILIGEGLIPQSIEIANREIGSSEFARSTLGAEWGTPPFLNLEGESELHHCLAELAKRGLITSAADISDGGIAIALARATLAHSIGAQVTLPSLADGSPVHTFFGEHESAAVVTCTVEQGRHWKEVAGYFDHLQVIEIGKTTARELSIRYSAEGGSHSVDATIDISLQDIKAAYSSTLESQLAAEVITA
jgi:phosphoribosylformylglycinamidine synthase